MDLFKPVEFLEPLYNFISTPTGNMIFCAACIFTLFVLLKVHAEFYFNCVFLLFVIYILFSGQEYYNQNKSTSTPQETQENSASVAKEQTDSKENTVNLKCTVTENGDYLCKKQKEG